MPKDKKFTYDGTMDGDRIATHYIVNGRKQAGNVSVELSLDIDFDPGRFREPEEAVQDALRSMAEHWGEL